MLSRNILRVYTVYTKCDKIIIRTLRGRNPVVGANPGLNNRIKAFKNEGIEIDDDDTEEFMDKSESDLFSAGESYSEHLNETLMGKHILRHQIVKEKYFKEHMPNLLTWSEKEQIRHLCTEHPKEWPPERIAESFPVTAEAVKKLLKYPWKPANLQRIARHDQSALRNWKELKEGSLDIPEELRQHFLKFSDRTIPPLDKKNIKIDVTQEAEMGEFQKVVDRCAREENVKAEREESINEESHQPINKDYTRMTLDELTTKIKTRISDGREVDYPDQIIAKSVKTNNESMNDIESIQGLEIKTKENNLQVKKEEPVIVATYPERIRIPKKAYKSGATYKVNDCYYDCDGKFLYRVLGLTN